MAAFYSEAEGLSFADCVKKLKRLPGCHNGLIVKSATWRGMKQGFF
jgi:hypothetical protein